MTAVLETHNISKLYDGEAALDSFSVSLGENEYMSLLGPSGSGKSTLLKVICGFESPENGEILLNGQPITHMPAHKRGIGFVSQGFALFPHMTVFENVAFGLRYREENPLTDDREVDKKVSEILDLVGLSDLGGRGIAQISGGQMQRVALARTLVADPKVILLDEPLGALDANLRTRMRAELRRIRQTLGISFMHVTGNEQEALAMGDRVAVLDEGRLAQISDPDTLYNSPNSARVAGFLACYNMFSGNFGDGRTFKSPKGDLICNDTSQIAGAGKYCIRYDKIHVVPVDHALAAGETSMKATYITSEYSGPSITYLFKSTDEQIIEVEYHLSHKKPEDFEPGKSYLLLWNANDSLVFKE